MKNNMIQRSIAETADVVQQNVTKHMLAEDLQFPKTGEHYEEFSIEVDHLSLGPTISGKKFWSRDGVIIWSDDRELVGKIFEDNDELNTAFSGEIVAEPMSSDDLHKKYNGRAARQRMLELYVPITYEEKGAVEAVVEVYQNLGPLYRDITAHRKIIWTRIIFSFSMLYVILFGIVFGASRRLDRQNKDLEEMFLQATIAMGNALDAKSPWTKGHSERTVHYAEKIACKMGLSHEDMHNLTIGGLLHDIGKIGTYDNLLHKTEKLTEEEFSIIKKHPEEGVKILESIKQLEKIVPIIRYHHERYDGKGYPDGLAGADIPLLARIVHVADSYDAMTADRPYRSALSHEQVIEELKRNAGTQFDPEVVDVFLSILTEETGYNKEISCDRNITEERIAVAR
jgi:putative nucleotidyltransferase with HDIG domain